MQEFDGSNAKEQALMLSRTKETIKEMERGSKIGPLRKKQAEA
jgi:hypothetical protein